MKKAKLALALVAGLAATIGLSSCDDVTYNAGVVLTYKDANGTRVDYTAAELFGEYTKTNSAASTEFDKVYELLVRKYYNTDKMSAYLAQINVNAQNKVNADKITAENNASSNGTTYQEEIQKILKSHNVDTIDQDFDYWQYQLEKEEFENDFYQKNIDAIRDGVKADSTAIFPASQEFGLGSNGYLKEKMPYHVRHILRKVSAASGELAQGKISEDDAKILGTIVKELAGEGETAATRLSFGAIAQDLSDDGSKDTFGDLGKMDLDESYVNEFKLGVYAFDALYNNESNDYRDANKDKLVNADYKQAFVTRGIGTIPYGAAIALLNNAKEDGSTLEYKVNDGNETFLPRNIIFNKYFNKHNVCVITPNDIEINNPTLFEGETTDPDTSDLVLNKAENFDGKYNAAFGALPGFQHDTTNILPQFTNNVLTDNSGHIVLAVRAGASGSYEGVHFIVIERSALNEFGSEVVSNKTVERTAADTAGKTATLSEYWTTKSPDQAAFPKNTANEEKTTFVNFFRQTTTDMKDRASKVLSAIKGYNNSIQTYIFQNLVESENITFADEDVGNTIKSYIRNKREKAADDTAKSQKDAWRTYAEFLVNQDNVRNAKADGTGYLISETCAIGYLRANAKNQTGLWAKGGACYGK